MARSVRTDQAALARILRDQDGVISRGEALSCGMTEGQLRHLIRPGGPWQRLLPGVYLTVTGTRTSDQAEIAALRYAGPAAAITGIGALRRHGVPVPALAEVAVLVPAGHRRRPQPGVTVVPTTRMPEFIMASGAIRFTLAARAVADAGRQLGSFRDYRAVVAGAVQRRRCTLDELTGELAGMSRRHSGWLREALAEVADGVRSVAEGDLRTLIRRAGLPAPMYNARLYAGSRFVAVTDAWWPEAGVAAEVDSRQWHLSPDAYEQTLRRRGRLTGYGILVVPLTPKQIRTDPQTVAAQIRGALERGRARPALNLRALPAA
jgi:hypothetical protein